VGSVYSRDIQYILEETLVSEDAFAGESFHFQPMVSLYEENTGAIATGFQGDVYAILISGPTGHEKLRFNGTIGSTTDNAVTFYGGIATFKDLTLNEAGSGYRLRYIARKYVGGEVIEVAQVTGKQFSNARGQPHHLNFVVYPGSASGGLMLEPQPIIAIADLGGNTIDSINEGYVIAELGWQNNITMGGEVVKLRGQTTIAIENGIAVFTDLFIHEASIEPYHIVFRLYRTPPLAVGTWQLEESVLKSNPFGVGIGAPYALKSF